MVEIGRFGASGLKSDISRASLDRDQGALRLALAAEVARGTLMGHLDTTFGSLATVLLATGDKALQGAVTRPNLAAAIRGKLPWPKRTLQQVGNSCKDDVPGRLV